MTKNTNKTKTGTNLIEANVVNKGSDVQFLLYIHTLLELLGEDTSSDTMYRLRNIIKDIDVDKRTKLNYKNNTFDEMLTFVEQKMKDSKGGFANV